MEKGTRTLSTQSGFHDLFIWLCTLGSTGTYEHEIPESLFSSDDAVMLRATRCVRIKQALYLIGICETCFRFDFPIIVYF